MTALARPRAAMLPVAVLSLLALSLALKAIRYVKEQPDTPGAAMQRIEHRLSADGWSRTATDVFPEGMPLFAAHFAKPGCPATTVTILGRKSELMHYVAGTYGGDVLFVPSGSSPDRGTVTKPLPLLAIAPRSRSSDCELLIAN